MQITTASSKLPKSIKAAILCALMSMMGFYATTYFDQESHPSPMMVPIASKILKFEDQSDGGVRVIDYSSKETIHVIHGEAGFVRSILRTVARERRMRGIGSEEPIEISAYNDGRLILKDPVTNTKIQLEAFGSTNYQAFNELLYLNKKKSSS